MRRTIITDEAYMDFYKYGFFGNLENPIKSAIHKAYRDLCRTITGLSKNKNKAEIRHKAEESIYGNITLLFGLGITTQLEFDKWHKKSCEDLIVVFREQKFTYGQAQKWINMTLKYISMIDYNCIENIYEYCHIPIDNYIIRATNKKLSVAWSRLENYNEYLDYQNWFRKEYDGIPLDIEFKMWLKEAKYEGEL